MTRRWPRTGSARRPATRCRNASSPRCSDAHPAAGRAPGSPKHGGYRLQASWWIRHSPSASQPRSVRDGTFRDALPERERAREVPLPGSRRPAALRWPHSSQAMPFGSAELRGPGGSAVNLVDCAEDHRRGTLDGPADRVPRGGRGDVSRRAACRPGRARRPGWWSCRSRTYSSAANRADDISPSRSWRQGRVHFLTLLEPLAGQPVCALTPGRPVAWIRGQ